MKDFHRAIIFIFVLLAPLSLFAADDSLATFKAMKPEVALEVAQATMMACREAGYQVRGKDAVLILLSVKLRAPRKILCPGRP